MCSDLEKLRKKLDEKIKETDILEARSIESFITYEYKIRQTRVEHLKRSRLTDS